MTRLHHVAVLTALMACAAAALDGAGLTTEVASAPGAKLKAISARSTAKSASLVIEATEPVPYVAMAPDPLTLLLDFRNVDADGIVNRAKDSKSPIARVAVEHLELLGAPVSRVRVSLTDAVAHRVRSDRNTIVIDFDKPARGLDGDSVRAPSADPIEALGLSAKPSDPQAHAPSARQRSAAAAVLIAAQTPDGTPQPPPQAPPAGAAQNPPEQPAAAREQRRYTGNPVSLEFDNADLRAVLTTFSDISGLNMVIDPNVQGTVTVRLTDVPWDQALDIILRANKLGYIIDGTVVRIAPLTVLSDEEAQRRKLAEEQALAGELRVMTKTLSYAKAEDLQSLLTKSALSARGIVQVDQRTNTVIITDLADRLQTATDLIATLDRPQPQVEIEARIVQTNKNFARQLGVQWGFGARVDPALGNSTNLAFPNNGSLTGRTGGTQGPAGTPTAVNLAAQGATSAVGLALGSVNGAFNLDVALSALETSGNGRVLSTPRVTTQNNIPAEMTQGTQIPIQTVANNTITVTFKDAALTLKVTPQITASNTVILQIGLENSRADFTRAVNGIPPINTQRANTSVLVNDGETTVIGGVFVSDTEAESDRTPGLGSVPLLRWLFKREINTATDQELLIFITPRVVKG